MPEWGRITAVVPQRRPRRISLFVDGEFTLGLDRELAAELGLTVGREVDRAALTAARARDAEKGARDYALGLLGARAYAAGELARRLARRGYPEPAVQGVLAFLERQGWIDDHAFARQYVQARSQGRGAQGERRLAQDLRRRGVDPEIIRAVLREQFQTADAVGQAAELARARLGRLQGVDRQAAYRRLGGFLARRGFDPGTVARALREVLDKGQ